MGRVQEGCAAAAPGLSRSGDPSASDAEALFGRLRRTRAATIALAAPLTAEDQMLQSMPEASPTKWHLAHTTWFWEAFVLGPKVRGYAAYDERFAYLFNSYYETLGPRHDRAARGLISRPSGEEVLEYRAHVDAALTAFAATDPEGFLVVADLISLGIAHEEQHQELILTDIKHALSLNPSPVVAYPAPEHETRAGEAPPLAWESFEGGEVWIGAEGGGFAFDNEGPRHRTMIEPFALASRQATNGEWLAFVEEGGYDAPALWLSDGWAMRQANGWRAPVYWRWTEDGWSELTLHGLRPLDLAAPAAHVSLYEAAAFAEWAGARLPDEREWETAARGLDPEDGRFAVPGLSPHPRPARVKPGLQQMFGDVWEWTRSAYAPYPRYRPPAGAIGEYNGKFMSGQMVLRGGSCASPRGHLRASYRNFFPPGARWQFSGVRLARDA
jgi:ergothioneine biosynthesis protein EgtB